MKKIKLWHLIIAALLAMIIYYNRPSFIEKHFYKSLSLDDGVFLGDIIYFTDGCYTINWPKIYYNGEKGNKEAFYFCFCKTLYIYMPEEDKKIGEYYQR